MSTNSTPEDQPAPQRNNWFHPDNRTNKKWMSRETGGILLRILVVVIVVAAVVFGYGAIKSGLANAMAAAEEKVKSRDADKLTEANRLLAEEREANAKRIEELEKRMAEASKAPAPAVSLPSGGMVPSTPGAPPSVQPPVSPTVEGDVAQGVPAPEGSGTGTGLIVKEGMPQNPRLHIHKWLHTDSDRKGPKWGFFFDLMTNRNSGQSFQVLVMRTHNEQGGVGGAVHAVGETYSSAMETIKSQFPQLLQEGTPCSIENYKCPRADEHFEALGFMPKNGAKEFSPELLAAIGARKVAPGGQ